MGRPSLFQLLVVLAFAISILVSNSSAYDGFDDNTSSTQLTLNVYVDDTGKALVTGYAEDIGGLSFLETSQYEYDEETGQLYAITNSLTWKQEDDWGISYSFDAIYDEFHVVFYLPSEVKLGKINSSDGTEYFVSASNDSIVVEFYGDDVESPAATIGYQQPLQGEVMSDYVDGETSMYQLVFVAVLIAAFLSAIALIKIRKKEEAEIVPVPPNKPIQEKVTDEQVQEPGLSETLPEEVATEPVLDQDSSNSVQKWDADVTVSQASEEKKEIEITSEMAAVMETLTERERAVLNTLIDHKGRITQAEIRYETKIPKSSLTGIILSLERRKLIIKKEYGRTNIIELSEWFKCGKRSD